MEYMKKYSSSDLFDMFANQAQAHLLANQSVYDIECHLLELAPDMEDAAVVAGNIKNIAYDLAYPDGPENNRHKAS
jgi:hypothetical protein